MFILATVSGSLGSGDWGTQGESVKPLVKNITEGI